MSDASTLRSLLKKGAMSRTEILRLFNINENNLQELLNILNSELIEFGEVKNTSYALRRKIREYNEFYIWEIPRKGQPTEIGNLIPVYPEGYIILWKGDRLVEKQYYSRSLPWWIYDMRPQGFIGRSFANKMAEILGVSKRINDWSDDEILLALQAFGTDVVGNFIITNNRAIYQILSSINLQPISPYLATNINLTIRHPEINKKYLYKHLAFQALKAEEVGSSAGGEQPKFVARLFDPNCPINVIVKFTAPDNNTITRRWASLLQAECLATKVLNQASFASAMSGFLEIDGQYFLEVERFDRVGIEGRLGQVSLAAVDSEFVGQADATWSTQSIELQKQGLISVEDAETMQKLEAFGRMIGNADMHLGNLSFFHEQTTNLRLAPVYDMLPMLFAPRASGHIPNDVPEIRLVTPPALKYWQEMFPIALQYWQQILTLPQPDETFKPIAEKFIERLNELKPKIGL
ncbi:type II toxin-antitoxin system HipA family toxin YjjJ [Thiofilum flexile]|uniref:type II toxin-antitoxin system HipA family toxin YjjJ n=1 Tax=Thiofilum flexile TaxID=125627 RepID=UPI00037AAA85|nr:type II toxin-antitoxin system HipA family toxin YjjJ [Thiofilum flexile]